MQLDSLSHIGSLSGFKIIKAKEQLLMDAVTHALGHKDWELDELIGRAEMRILEGGVEQFCLDDKPLIEFYWLSPVDVETTDPAVFKYKKLYKEEK